MVKALPTTHIDGKSYFIDLQLKELRNVEDPVDRIPITRLVDEGLDEFWDFIANRFPHAKYGDLSPERTIRLLLAAEEAAIEWIANNCV